ncbi:MAG TPA: hypothetical protein VEO54_32345 [Thermoanaerobaculia bacterium]|nr:hypothetical protein [Thermoanaerobaculia bacterium]
MTVSRLTLLMTAAVLLTAAVCTHDEPSLIVLEGATNVRSEGAFGPQGVEYDLPPGDGNAAVAELHRRLTAAGWQPASELVELREPGSSSFTSGWLCEPPAPFRFHWVANWRDPKSGDVASYTVICSTEPPRCAQREVMAYVVRDVEPPPAASGTPNTGISTQCRDLQKAAREGTLH